MLRLHPQTDGSAEHSSDCSAVRATDRNAERSAERVTNPNTEHTAERAADGQSGIVRGHRRWSRVQLLLRMVAKQ